MLTDKGWLASDGDLGGAAKHPYERRVNDCVNGRLDMGVAGMTPGAPVLRQPTLLDMPVYRYMLKFGVKILSSRAISGDRTQATLRIDWAR